MSFRLEVLGCQRLPLARVLTARCRVVHGFALVGQAAVVRNFFVPGVSTKILGLELGLRGSATDRTVGEITVLLPFDERVASVLRHSTAVIDGIAEK